MTPGVNVIKLCVFVLRKMEIKKIECPLNKIRKSEKKDGNTEKMFVVWKYRVL